MFTHEESKNRLCVSKQGQLANCDDFGGAIKWPLYSKKYPFYYLSP